MSTSSQQNNQNLILDDESDYDNVQSLFEPNIDNTAVIDLEQRNSGSDSLNNLNFYQKFNQDTIHISSKQ